MWCGQNSIGVVELVVAARKLGATAVPLNYRLSDEEAAYVTDHSDATIVYVDAEMAPMFARIRQQLPKVAEVLVFDGEAPAGTTAVDQLVGRRADRAARARRGAGNRGDDDLHVGHHRQAEGRPAHERTPIRSSRRRCCSSSATRPTTCT